MSKIYTLSNKIIPDLNNFHKQLKAAIPGFNGLNVVGNAVQVELDNTVTTALASQIEAVIPANPEVLNYEYVVENYTTTIQTTSKNSYATTDMVLSLPAGAYYINYICTVSATSNRRNIDAIIFKGDDQINNTKNSTRVEDGTSLLLGLIGDDGSKVPLLCSSIIVLNQSAVISLRWKTSGGTAVMQERKLVALRIA